MRLPLVLLALGGAAAGGALGHLAAGRGVAPALERLATSAVAAEADLFLDHHARAVAALAERFREWEVLVPEGLESQLRVVSSRFPALARLLVADPAGQVLAAFDVAARVGAERAQRGGPDPVDARRRAMAGATAPLRLPVVEAGTVTRVTVGVPFFAAGGELRGYVGADLELAPLAERLACQEAAAGVALGLLDARGRVLYPRDRTPPEAGRRATAGDFTVIVALPIRSRLWPPAAGAGVGLALVLAAAAAARRKPA
jgi:hypothetical protein